MKAVRLIETSPHIHLISQERAYMTNSLLSINVDQSTLTPIFHVFPRQSPMHSLSSIFLPWILSVILSLPTYYAFNPRLPIILSSLSLFEGLFEGSFPSILHGNALRFSTSLLVFLFSPLCLPLPWFIQNVPPCECSNTSIALKSTRCKMEHMQFCWVRVQRPCISRTGVGLSESVDLVS